MWWVSFVIFAALAGLWSLSTPLGAGPDEPAHIVKAVAVAHGNFDSTVVVVHPAPGYSVPRTTLDVPRAYAALDTARGCYILRPEVPASCAPPFDTDTRVTPAITEAGAYPPLYYLLVGWPSRILSPRPAIFAMRMIGALASAALLASGLVSALSFTMRRRRAHLAVTGAALAVTPMALYLAGVVNPNGLEIAAAFCLWLALLDLLGRAGALAGTGGLAGTDGLAGAGPVAAGIPTRLIVRIVIAAIVVAGLRPLSPAFLAVIVAAVLVAAADRSRLGVLWSDRRVRIGCAVIGVAVLGFVAYVVINRSYDAVIGLTFPDDPSRLELAHRSWARSWSRIWQMIGIFGSLDAALPSAIVTAWVAAVLALSAAAVAVGRWRDRFVMVAALAGALLLPVVAETVSGPKTGLAWQGRYTLTVAVGAPILAGWILDRSGRVPRRPAVAAGVVVAVAVAAAQLAAHLRSMGRYIVGLPSDWLAYLHHGTWVGPVSPAPLLGLAIAASVAYAAWLGWLTASGPDGGPAPARGEGSGVGEVVVDDDAQRGEEGPGQLDDLGRAQAGAPQ